MMKCYIKLYLQVMPSFFLYAHMIYMCKDLINIMGISEIQSMYQANTSSYVPIDCLLKKV